VRAVMNCHCGRFSEAAAASQEFLARTSAEEQFTTWWLAQAEAYSGRDAEAVAHLRRCGRHARGYL